MHKKLACHNLYYTYGFNFSWNGSEMKGTKTNRIEEGVLRQQKLIDSLKQVRLTSLKP